MNSGATTSAAYPTRQFEIEMELERRQWLRRRFLWMSGLSVLVGLPVAAMLYFSWTTGGGGADGSGQAVRLCWLVLTTGIYLLAMVYAWVRAREVRTIMTLAMWVVGAVAASATPVERFAAHLEGPVRFGSEVKEGFREGLAGTAGGSQHTTTRDSVHISRPGMEIQFRASDLGLRSSTRRAATTGSASNVAANGSTNGDSESEEEDALQLTPGLRTALFCIYSIFSSHLVACIFMPWTLREALRLALIALGSYAAVVSFDTVIGQLPLWGAVLCVMGATASLVPGTTLCWWRSSRFKKQFRLQFESGRYRELRDDLDSARKIHESCMPQPITDGPVRINFAYRPMNSIGGDLLFHRKLEVGSGEASSGESHLVAIVDVTGHGVAAALTVNRLLGEIERLIGETPAEVERARPGMILTALNRYVRIMLSQHGLYFSAKIFRFDVGPSGTARRLTYASGGHPTAYILSAGRPTRHLESTAPLLGAVGPEEFSANEQQVDLDADEVLLACTDGATETRLDSGDLLRTAGMQALAEEVLRSGPITADQLPDACLRRIDGLRPGEVEDDTLLVAMRWG